MKSCRTNEKLTGLYKKFKKATFWENTDTRQSLGTKRLPVPNLAYVVK